MLGTKYSHVGNKIFPRWEQNIPKVGTFSLSQEGRKLTFCIGEKRSDEIHLFSTNNLLDLVEFVQGLNGSKVIDVET